MRAALRVILAAGALLALTTLRLAAEDTSEGSAIHECIAKKTRAAAESIWGQNDLNGFEAEVVRESTREETSNESGQLTPFQNGIWKECLQRLSSDAARVGQQGAAALVRKALDALSFERNKEVYGERKASEMRDLDEAGDAYDKCLEAKARSLAQVSAEPAETVAKAVFAACGPQRILLQAARYKYGEDGREFVERYDHSFVGDIILDIIKAREPTTTAPTSAKKLR